MTVSPDSSGTAFRPLVEGLAAFLVSPSSGASLRAVRDSSFVPSRPGCFVFSSRCFLSRVAADEAEEPESESESRELSGSEDW